MKRAAPLLSAMLGLGALAACSSYAEIRAGPPAVSTAVEGDYAAVAGCVLDEASVRYPDFAFSLVDRGGVARIAARQRSVFGTTHHVVYEVAVRRAGDGAAAVEIRSREGLFGPLYPRGLPAMIEGCGSG